MVRLKKSLERVVSSTCLSITLLMTSILGLFTLGEVITSPFLSDTQALELQDIRERGYLIVAVKDNVRPLAFRDENGEIVGLEIDIARRLAAEVLGDPKAILIQPVSNDERLSSLLTSNVDIVIAQLGITDARSRLTAFSTPYYIDGIGFVTRDETIQNLGDLSSSVIAVLNHSTSIDTVRSFFPNVTLVGVASYEEALSLLEVGQADAFASDASILSGWVQEYPRYRVITPFISATGLAIAMPHGVQYDDLRQLINHAVEQWRRDGWLDERASYWGLL